MHKIALALAKGLFTILVYSITNSAFGQFSWIHEFHSGQDVFSHKLTIDPHDNIYMVGNFSSTITLDDFEYTGGGAYLVKYDEFGVYKWHRVFKGSSNEHLGLNLIDSDKQGNIYVSGFFTGSIDLGDRVLTGNGFSSYLIKFDPDGEIIWANSFSGLQEIFGISVNSNGEVLIYSWHSTGVVVSQDANAFGALFSAEGNLIWAKTLGNQNFNTSIPISAKLDDKGNAYFTGTFDGSMRLDGLEIVSSGIHDLFLVKLNKQAECTLLKSFRRKIDPIYENIYIVERGSVTADENENIFIGSGYWSEIILDEFTLQGNSIYNGTFVARLNADGKVLWANGTEEHSVAENLSIHEDKIYLSGVINSKPYFSSLDLDQGSAISPIRFPLEYTDIVVGFGIDSKDSIYMSGRRGLATSPVFRGFLFKYKPDTKIPKAVLSPITYCVNIDEVSLSTIPIANATSYEWEIIDNGNVIVLTSQTPNIILSISQHNIEGNFSIRVRGLNNIGPGPFSEVAQVIGVNNPSLVINSTCNSVFVEQGENYQWFIDDLPAPDYGEELEIFPVKSGIYSISGTNACGSFSSNKVIFESITLAGISMPNIITPNADLFNDSFIVDNILENPSISIYNRWGKQVYQNSTYDNSWSAEGLANGNYYYTLKSKCLPDPIKGWITVLR